VSGIEALGPCTNLTRYYEKTFSADRKLSDGAHGAVEQPSEAGYRQKPPLRASNSIPPEILSFGNVRRCDHGQPTFQR
jgi:hypothetical protein